MRHPKGVTAGVVVATLLLAAMLPLIKVDTDPENMLAHDEPVRVFHDQTKARFNLNDMIVVGVVNEKHRDGVFNAGSLGRIYRLTEFAARLQWSGEEVPSVEELVRIGRGEVSGRKSDGGRPNGVVSIDLIAPSTVDHIQGDAGTVRFEWLMNRPPQDDDEAGEIRDKAMRNPLLLDTMVSVDGKAIAIYIPITSKDLSYRIAAALRVEIDSLGGQDDFHITGLPVAEDTFGVEMFKQMAISAPAAMLTIFVLMMFFFRKLVLVLSAMIVAMVTVIITMGLMIGLGYPVHIMSSMIPIFLMPISVVDSIHIISEFFDRYTREKGRQRTMREVMSQLFVPMLYTSLTSAAGFLSLAITPIPPVQVFGVFVAIGIMIAWVLTVMFIPAYVMFIPERRLMDFGSSTVHGEESGRLGRWLRYAGSMTFRRAKVILTAAVVLLAVSVYGITRIQVNDNPVRWFSEKHSIRVADKVLNSHFGGTYMAYLVLDGNQTDSIDHEFVDTVRRRLFDLADRRKGDYPGIDAAAAILEGSLISEVSNVKTKKALLDSMAAFAMTRSRAATEPDDDYMWEELATFFDAQQEALKTFKRPDVLQYISDMQSSLAGLEDGNLVGKSNSLSDIVKKVHQELIDGRQENYRIPDRADIVAQCLIQFQSSHTPDDLWQFVTSDYSHANIWLQLRSGDNREMGRVVAAVEQYFANNPPPVDLNVHWAGLTYINVVWQQKMVNGMLMSFLGSFVIVFVMMIVMFRSVLWGLVSMIPLTITIALIYGAIGLVGKDYDMPVAVLSSLTLGMAVDFAIHFLQRARLAYARFGSWKAASAEMFDEPARAISRNVLVVAIGFLPLLLAPLVPYKTVGILVCAIMAISGAITMFILPSLLRVAERAFFRATGKPVGVACNCGLCFVVTLGTVVVVMVNAATILEIRFSVVAIVTLAFIPAAAVICGIVSRRQVCRQQQIEAAGEPSAVESEV